MERTMARVEAGAGVGVGSIPIIVNPGASHADPEKVRQEAVRWLPESRIDLRVLGPGDRAAGVAERALEDGARLVVVAGGDGTVSGAASALAGTGVPLAIVPMGGANMLAEQLGIPKSPQKAMELALREHELRAIDAMEMEGRLYFLNVGVGVSSETVERLRDGDKRRFGMLAYLLTGVGRSMGFRPAEFRVTIDEAVHEFRGIEVSLINAGFQEGPNFPSFPDIQPDDGVIDVLLIWKPTPTGYLRHLSHAALTAHRVERNVRWLRARSEVRIEAERKLPMQADGDLVAQTPVRVRLVPGAVQVVVPPGAAVMAG